MNVNAYYVQGTAAGGQESEWGGQEVGVGLCRVVFLLRTNGYELTTGTRTRVGTAEERKRPETTCPAGLVLRRQSTLVPFLCSGRCCRKPCDTSPAGADRKISPDCNHTLCQVHVTQEYKY